MKEQYCPNCKFPFQGYEKFCPNCGQNNKLNKLNFKNFINEVFKGFTSWDAKFWKTLSPLLFKPGKISEDYKNGKRARYTNPFRFYIIVSFIFFLVEGFVINNENIVSFGNSKDEIKINPEQKDKVDKEINLINKYPFLKPEQALDSLGIENTLSNRLGYKSKRSYHFFKLQPQRSMQLIVDKTMSYAPTTLLITLPIFTLLFGLLYIKKKHNTSYIDHLIFIFHTQTVFLILMLFSSLCNLIGLKLITFALFLFAIYLFIAMKRFYKQSIKKTLLKEIIAITTYTILLAINSLLILSMAFVSI